MSSVISSYVGPPGLVASARVQVRDALTGTLLQARTNTGITEDSFEPGFYEYLGSLPDAAAYAALWDFGGATYQPPGEGEIVGGDFLSADGLVIASYTGVPGASVSVRVEDTTTGATISNGTTGVREDVAGSGFFVVARSIGAPIGQAKVLFTEGIITTGDIVYAKNIFSAPAEVPNPTFIYPPVPQNIYGPPGMMVNVT